MNSWLSCIRMPVKEACLLYTERNYLFISCFICDYKFVVSGQFKRNSGFYRGIVQFCPFDSTGICEGNLGIYRVRFSSGYIDLSRFLVYGKSVCVNGLNGSCFVCILQIQGRSFFEFFDYNFVVGNSLPFRWCRSLSFFHKLIVYIVCIGRCEKDGNSFFRICLVG